MIKPNHLTRMWINVIKMNINTGATQASELLGWQFVKRLSRVDLVWRLQRGQIREHKPVVTNADVYAPIWHLYMQSRCLFRRAGEGKEPQSFTQYVNTECVMASCWNSVIPNNSKNTFNPTGEWNWFHASHIFIYLYIYSIYANSNDHPSGRDGLIHRPHQQVASAWILLFPKGLFLCYWYNPSLL